jgi:hypothetical protein
VETPSASIAMVRCSSLSRSVQEMPSIACLGYFSARDDDSNEELKNLLKVSKGV